MSSRAKILVVEDEKDVRDLLVLHLKREGHEVMAAEDGESALRLLDHETFGLVVLDWMLPGVSGLEICKRLRALKDPVRASVPILLVTARADTTDIVVGLEVGADDYITKPFEIPILLARARALLRRAQIKPGVAKRLRLGDVTLDADTHQVVCEGKSLELTPSEFKLLHALMKNEGRVLSRERLIDLVQGEGVSVVDRAIDTHVFGLRKKMGDQGELIETIRGVGYRVRMNVGGP